MGCWVGMGWVLDWIWLCWVMLGWVWLYWIWLCWVGLGWVGFGLVGERASAFSFFAVIYACTNGYANEDEKVRSQINHPHCESNSRASAECPGDPSGHRFGARGLFSRQESKPVLEDVF